MVRYVAVQNLAEIVKKKYFIKLYSVDFFNGLLDAEKILGKEDECEDVFSDRLAVYGKIALGGIAQRSLHFISDAHLHDDFKDFFFTHESISFFMRTLYQLCLGGK